MADFPAESFRLEGEPGAIRTSAAQWLSFGEAATDAASQIRSLDTSLFIGPEGDQYREGLNDKMPPHLKTTGDAYNKAGRALNTFAGELSELQDRMRPLAVKAPSLWEALKATQGRVSSAKAADKQHQRQLEADAATRPADQPAPPDTYHSDAAVASSALSAAQQAWDECLAAANKVKADHQTVVNTCERAIRDAAGMRFAHNPKGFAKLAAGVKDFIKDHAEGLAKLSGVLKVVSAIAGVLSFIPVLNFVMAPLAIVTGLAALAIDVSIYAATGKGSLTNIVIDGALMALPGVGKLAGAGIKSLRGANAAENVVHTAAVAKSATSSRVTLRAGTKRAIYAQAERAKNNEDFLCAATGDTIPAARAADGTAIRVNPETGRLDPSGMTVPEKGTFHFGHTPGNEWRTFKVEAEAQGLSRQQVIEAQNNPDIYRLETPAANLSHRFEAP